MLNVISRINSLLSKMYTCFIRNKFAHLGKSKIYINTVIDNPGLISIGNNTVVRSNSWLMAIKNTNNSDPKLRIGSNVYLGHNLHLIALEHVVIEDDVLIADKVFISDNIHEYNSIELPIKNQSLRFKGAVTISRGAWIGENVCIIGSSIGKNSVVGANSVVVKDVPDYVIVGGNPAIIIKEYNLLSKKWEKHNSLLERDAEK
jgi:acetyltransferase-like isoleucine patch superfamily enzyme